MIYLMMVDTAEDKRKFVILYVKYKYLILQVAYDVLQDYYLAEDAVHETFLKVAKNMEKIGEVNLLETKRYLVTIAKNAAIDIYRKRNLRMAREIYVDELAESEEPVTFMESDLDNGILEILSNLPVKYRDVFILKYSERKENSEIAELLGISEGTVRQRIFRGKEMIQQALDGKEGKESERNSDDR